MHLEMMRLDHLILELSVRVIQHSDFGKEVSALKYFAGIMGYDTREQR